MSYEAQKIYNGTVKFYNQQKGFGFISVENHGDIFVNHRNVMPSESGPATLTEGQPVKFFVVDGPKGPEAAYLRVGNHPEHAVEPSAAVEEPANDNRIYRGVVKYFNDKKGFGFITREDGNGDVFVHYPNLDGEGYRTLKEGETVEFTLSKGKRGNEAFGVKHVEQEQSASTNRVGKFVSRVVNGLQEVATRSR